jgi:hypothetical protein
MAACQVWAEGTGHAIGLWSGLYPLSFLPSSRMAQTQFPLGIWLAKPPLCRGANTWPRIQYNAL